MRQSVDIPKFYQFFNIVLGVLKDNAREMHRDEIIKVAIKIVIEKFNINLSSDELPISTSASGNLLADRIIKAFLWALTYLKFASLLENERRGFWKISESGILQYPIKDEQEFAKEISKKFINKAEKENKVTRKFDRSEDEQKDGLRNEEIENLQNDAWKHNLITAIRSIKPDGFERFCKMLFEKLGFIEVYNTQQTRDGGVDGFGILRNNIISTKVAFECKKYDENNKVNVDVLGKLRNAMKVNHISHGFILTTSYFTKDAVASARAVGDIDLIDGDELCKLIKKVSLGVKVEMVEEIKINYEFFEKV